jgi:NADH-ubiquinone oxidoreductase chain 3
MRPLITIFLIIILTLSIVLITVGRLLSPHAPYIEKASPYECGFNPINSPRLPFSFRFFLIAILFLIFDLEIALLLVFPFSLSLLYPIKRILFITFFLIILALGLYYEWSRGGLEWAED